MSRIYVDGATQPRAYVSPPPSPEEGSIAEHEAAENPHPQYAKQRGYGLTITTNGQTVIPLPVAVTDPTRVGVYLNTTRQRYGVDWTASGTSLTWLATGLTLTPADALEILI